MSSNLAQIPPAHGGVITDDVLDAVTAIATRMADQSIRDTVTTPFTDAELSLFMVAVPGLLGELQQWRRKGALITDIMAPNNLLMFRGAA